VSDETPKVLKWFEVTWVTASGRSLVKAEDAGEARMIASEHAELASQAKIPVVFNSGQSILHQWIDPADQEPLIFDVDELAEDTAAELKRELEGG
jgi:hypothetical protein